MESIKKYTLTVFNTCTQEYEEVAVTEEVYRAYYRTGWNIKDNNQPSKLKQLTETSQSTGPRTPAHKNCGHCRHSSGVQSCVEFLRLGPFASHA